MPKALRFVSAEEVTQTVARLFVQANRELPPDVSRALRQAQTSETSPLAREALGLLHQNAACAAQTGMPICQDTGAATVFAEVGEQVHITGSDLCRAIEEGVRVAYRDGLLRCSIVSDPLFGRVNTGDNTPAFIHVSTCPGDRLTLRCMPKGFGSENTSRLVMMDPSAGPGDVSDFVARTVLQAGGKPCPPLVIGVGIGGTFDTVGMLAKEALFCPLDTPHPDPSYARLEREILEAVNATGVGAQGFGGLVTALGVHVKTAPTHIAGLPVAVSVCCHVCRHAEAVL